MTHANSCPFVLNARIRLCCFDCYYFCVIYFQFFITLLIFKLKDFHFGGTAMWRMYHYFTCSKSFSVVYLVLIYFTQQKCHIKTIVDSATSRYTCWNWMKLMLAIFPDSLCLYGEMLLHLNVPFDLFLFSPCGRPFGLLSWILVLIIRYSISDVCVISIPFVTQHHSQLLSFSSARVLRKSIGWWNIWCTSELSTLTLWNDFGIS